MALKGNSGAIINKTTIVLSSANKRASSRSTAQKKAKKGMS